MKILTVDYYSKNAPEQLSESLHNTGFAVVSRHPLCWNDIEYAYKEWAAFFSMESKHHYKFDPIRQDGYIPEDHEHQAANSKIKVKDIKEVFQLYFPWGQYPTEISDVSRKLFKQKFELAKIFLSWIESHLPSEIKSSLNTHLTDMVSMERTLYRAIHYPALSGSEEMGAVRAAAHEDFGFLTLLPAATEAGLQVKDKNGCWHEVGVDPKSLVINAGGTLQEATNFYYKSTVHQVVNPSGEAAKRARFSLPLFLHGKRESYLSRRYPTIGDYFDEQIKKLELHHY